MTITVNVSAEDFKKMTGVEPVQDDLERVNCERAGSRGHQYCGLCHTGKHPNFMCECIKDEEE
jgi:hypothetical protein